jgi:hypothetical protein
MRKSTTTTTSSKGKGKAPVKKTTTVVTQSTQSKPKLKAPKKRSGKSKSESGTEEVRKVIGTLVDPWVGATCLPDATQGACFTVRFSNAMLTDAAGTCNILLSPDIVNCWNAYVGNGTGGLSTTWSSGSTGLNGVPNLAVLKSLFAKYRLVSMGVHWIPTASVTTLGGGLVFAQLPGTITPSQLSGVNISGIYALATDLKECPVTETCKYAWRPDDWSKYGIYQPLNASAGNNYTQTQTPDLKPFLIGCVFGGPVSSTVGRFEMILNFEAQYSTTALSIGETEDIPAAQHDWMTRVANGIRKTSQFLEASAPLASKLAAMLL